MKLEQIKIFCEEAHKIAGQGGMTEGLAFLIGEKFSRILCEINKCENKLKFLYPEKNPFENIPSSLGKQSLSLNYALTVSSNYGDQLEKLDRLQTIRENFLQEIKKTFDPKEIQNYLDSHPRLGLKPKTVLNEEAETEKAEQEEELEFSAENILSEVEDIFIVEAMKKLFSR